MAVPQAGVEFGRGGEVESAAICVAAGRLAMISAWLAVTASSLAASCGRLSLSPGMAALAGSYEQDAGGGIAGGAEQHGRAGQSGYEQWWQPG